MATVRITIIKQNSSFVILKVEGAVVSESVGVLKEECVRWRDQKKTIQLDFSGVTSIDQEGVKMLGRMTQSQLPIIHCPDFIHHLLNLKDRG